MRLYCVDGRISTGLIAYSVFRIGYLMTYLGGGTQPVVRHGVRRTRVEAPIHTSPNADQGTNEHTRYDRNVTDLAVDFLA